MRMRCGLGSRNRVLLNHVVADKLHISIITCSLRRQSWHPMHNPGRRSAQHSGQQILGHPRRELPSQWRGWCYKLELLLPIFTAQCRLLQNQNQTMHLEICIGDISCRPMNNHMNNDDIPPSECVHANDTTGLENTRPSDMCSRKVLACWHIPYPRVFRWRLFFWWDLDAANKYHLKTVLLLANSSSVVIVLSISFVTIHLSTICIPECGTT